MADITFSKQKMDLFLSSYKEALPLIRKNEIYKWEATKCFQENWDSGAENYSDMLDKALSKSGNLLGSSAWFPKKMLLGFAEMNPAKTKKAFTVLFDENIDLAERLSSVEKLGTELLFEFNQTRAEDPAKSHYFDSRALSVYLAFMYPEKHFLYKTKMYTDFSRKLDIDFPGNKFEKVVAYEKLCNDLLHYLKTNNNEVIALSDSLLPEDLQKVDIEHHLLVQDFIYYISIQNAQPTESDWFPSLEDYNPNISKEQWVELLNDKAVSTENVLITLKCLRNYKQAATCKELADKFGRSYNFYNVAISTFGRRVYKKINCPVRFEETGNEIYWSIPCIGKVAAKEQLGIFAWRLRDELFEALKLINLSDIPQYENRPSDSEIAEEPQYWWLVAKASYWNYTELDENPIEQWTAYNENGNKRRIFSNIEAVKRGDKFIGYLSSPDMKAVCALTALSNFMDEGPIEKHGFLFGEKINAATPVPMDVIKNDPILSKMEYLETNPTGSLFKLTKEQYERLIELMGISETEPSKPVTSYTDADFLSEVYVSEEDLTDMKELLKRKKNLILQGSPGTGKTFAAKRLAYALMGEKDDSRIQMVQFHQSSTYDEFVVGYRPSKSGGFEVKNGTFVQFANLASSNPEKNYFFIIDEINRANISKVFGELLMLIEADHRGDEVTLLVSGESFSIPNNLYIIGMMNTADRGLALIDYALRRRFAFFEMAPALEHPIFVKEIENQENKSLSDLVYAVVSLNKEIENDPTLGKGFQIGHSYFCSTEEKVNPRSIVKYELIPLLEEYWFDNPEKVKTETQKLENAISE